MSIVSSAPRSTSAPSCVSTLNLAEGTSGLSVARRSGIGKRCARVALALIALAAPTMGQTSAAQTAVGTPGPVQTATIKITSAGTLGTIYVLTQGAPNLDFQLSTGGTCLAGALYGVNATCTVDYTFLPRAPGQRMGAVQLVDSTGTLPLGTTLLTGTGVGAALVFPGSTTTKTLGNGFYPSSVAVDAAGNIFFVDQYGDGVQEIVAVNGVTSSTSTVRTLTDTVSLPTFSHPTPSRWMARATSTSRHCAMRIVRIICPV